jgi:hypothetical protein
MDEVSLCELFDGYCGQKQMHGKIKIDPVSLRGLFGRYCSQIKQILREAIEDGQQTVIYGGTNKWNGSDMSFAVLACSGNPAGFVKVTGLCKVVDNESLKREMKTEVIDTKFVDPKYFQRYAQQNGIVMLSAESGLKELYEQL